ncbi:hypothetical protein CHS0354_028162 [Potamilus streckersoni]|uniref:Glutathione transferase n=1 Tax=Potamilus streckersoni TaxID=2493646 RepID=A0AAE0TJI0_9BIVA|nr:hypothetical protein CHS0354_028162 [Potamilus streckersoni]
MSGGNEPTLYYFNGRGAGEIIRLFLATAGVKFSEVFLEEPEQLEKLRRAGDLVFNQVPMLDIDGCKLVQGGAILRYIARKYGFYGKTNEESTMIDLYFEGSRDFQNAFMPIGFSEKDVVLKSVKENTLPRYLPIYEKVLSCSNSGFVFGSSMSLADVGLLEALLSTVDYFQKDVLKDYPHLQKFYNMMTTTPDIAAFLSGSQRKCPNDENYVKTVSRVLWNK